MKADWSNKTGIYCINHISCGKVYTGSSFNLNKRLMDHIYNRNSNRHLQNALNKYGIDKFCICILELLSTDQISKDDLMLDLIELEQMHLNMYSNKYNINPIAGKSRLGSKHTLESKALMSKLRRDNPFFLGKTHSESYKNKFKIRITGIKNHMFGKPVTEQNKKLRSEIFSKKTYVYNANTMELIKTFSTHKDWSLLYNISSKTIIKYKDSKLPFRNKYILSSILLKKGD